MIKSWRLVICYPEAGSQNGNPGLKKEDLKDMERQWKLYSLAFSVALGLAPTAMGQGGAYTAIDFPGSTQTWGVGPSSEVAGTYTSSGVTHGFKLTGNEYVTIDPPRSTGATATGINGLGEVSGICTISGIVHGFLLSDGEYAIFDVPGSTYTNSTALTAHGEVIGRYIAP